MFYYFQYIDISSFFQRMEEMILFSKGAVSVKFPEHINSSCTTEFRKGLQKGPVLGKLVLRFV